jgi:hypothetical protein
MPFPAIGLGTIAFLAWLGVDVGLIVSTGMDSIDHILNFLGLYEPPPDIIFVAGMSFEEFLVNYSMALVAIMLIIYVTWFLSTRPLKIKAPKVRKG